MENLEIEYKVMISKQDYNRLIENLNNYEIFRQINYYYDTINKDLHKNNLSLRIRHIVNKKVYIVTLKEKLSEGRKEYEFYVKDNDIEYLPNEIIRILSKVNIDYHNLINIGSLETLRYEIKANDYILCFDKNIYYEKEDYEVECESSSMERAKAVLSNFLNQYNVKWTPSKKSKQKRAIDGKI